MQYGLIGERLGHSFSKTIHGMLADYEYELREIAPEDFDAFMQAKDFCAINVTIPYKQKVIPYLDRIDETAKEIGAVNCIVNKNGALYGYNTDLGGVIGMIRHSHMDLSGKKVLIAGTGGTSNTVYTAAKILGAREILKVSRSKKPGLLTYQEAMTLHKDAEVLINTTPCGMYPDMDGIALSPEPFPNLCAVIDVIFNPLETRLLYEAKKRNIPAVGGLYMLVMQAVLASEIFLDTHYPAETAEQIYRKIKASKENIVLIGMPGCGKTTIGTLLAEALGNPLADTDEEIIASAGMPITEIFQTKGEDHFRDMESEAIRALSQKNGLIIATGGGAILREENVRMLHANGRVFFLNRPLETLLPTDTRPLSSTFADLKKRYEERLDKYLAAADVVLSGDLTPEETLHQILESELLL